MNDRTEDRRLLRLFGDSLLLERGLSPHTLSAYTSDVQQFSRWLAEQQRPLLLQAESVDIMDWLAQRLTTGSKARSAARTLSSLKNFYRFLRQERLCENDPTASVDAPKIGRPLPVSLSEQEVGRLLEAPDRNSLLGNRDHAMLELLYACGLRVSELVQLELNQLDVQRGVLRVWGKGNKERLVPIGEIASEVVSGYLEHTRPLLVSQARTSSEVVFVTRRGGGMTRQAFWHIIRKYAKAVDIQQHLSPHTLRHAFATHLVNHDADLRVVQMLLGHSSLSTTQIYTHVARQRMKQLHEAHHPRG